MLKSWAEEVLRRWSLNKHWQSDTRIVCNYHLSINQNAANYLGKSSHYALLQNFTPTQFVHFPLRLNSMFAIKINPQVHELSKTCKYLVLPFRKYEIRGKQRWDSCSKAESNRIDMNSPKKIQYWDVQKAWFATIVFFLFNKTNEYLWKIT